MNDFSQGSVKKRIIEQAIPLTLAQIVQLLYNMVDRIYIGHLPETGDLALTGVGITFPIIVLIAAFTGLFGNGAVPLFSITRGNKRDDEAENIMGNAFTLLMIAAVLLFAVCYLFRRPILFLFGASEASYEYADQYLQIYLFGTVCSMMATGMNGFINAQGFPRVGMLTTVVGAVINIVLDPVFIFGFHMGVQGAALATVISQAVSAVWVFRFLTGKKAILKLKKECFRLEAERVKRMVSLGIPSFVMQGSNCLVQVVCNNSLQTYGGDLYVGIMTVLNSVREMISLPVMGISSGSQPVLGYNYGAGEKERVKEGIRFMTLIGSVYTVFAWLVVLLIPQYIFRIFSNDELMIAEGAKALSVYFFGFVFMSFQFAGQSTFQGLGKSKKAIFFSLLRKVIIVVPLTLLLPVLGFGVNGVFLAEPISNVIGGLICFVTMWRTVYKRL
ncbi:MAG: MATE family efflux transporter [Lachnospiraceae bacterium]|nr:MATE family efflux transporter [Lachnospiraceae bacterium]MBP3610625.1 MATE family efflux transporter [Lachnospiraceae bacterium]